MDLAKIAKAFGFKVPPRVSLNVGVGVGGGAGAGAGTRRRRESGSEDEGEVMESYHDDMDKEDEEGREKKKRRREKSVESGSGQQGDGSVNGPMRVREGGWSKKKREGVLGKKRALKERHFRDNNTKRGKFGKNWSR